MVEDKLIVVTGASSGLGKTVVENLLLKNYQVLGIDKQPASIEHELYTHALIDLSEFSTANIAPLPNWYGFIHCAGVSTGGRISEMEIEDWDYSMSVNVTSAMKICKLASSEMVDFGRIVLVGSPVSIAGANKPSYSASKAALHGLTMSVSRTFGKRNITVNTVLPGPMITGMTEDWSKEKRQSVASGNRLNRLAVTGEVAHVICSMMDEEWSFMSASIVDLTCGSLYGH